MIKQEKDATPIDYMRKRISDYEFDKQNIKSVYQPKETTDYKMAFMRALEAKESEFEIAKCYHDNTHIVKYNERVFVVMSIDDLYSFCEDSFIHPDMAEDIPYAAIIDIAEDVHTRPEFYLEVSNSLSGTQKEILLEAITVSKLYDDNIDLFWTTIRDSDDFEFLYGECVVALAKVFDFQCCVDELVEFYQSYGDEFLCEMRYGIFTEIDISDKPHASNENNADADYNIFYVYNVDTYRWEINQDGLREVASKKKKLSVKNKKRQLL